MSTIDPPTPPPLPSERNATRMQSGWQFSMRSMMLGVTVFATMCGLLVVLPHVTIIALGLALYATVGVLTTGILFGRGNQRAFCIGALTVVLSTWTRTGGGLLGEIVDIFEWFLRDFGVNLHIYVEAALKYFVLIPLAIANGYLCIRARHYFEQRPED